MNRDFLMEGLDAAEELTQDKSYLGVLDTQIVGIRYYTGRVMAKEMVLLERDPANPYDYNAIKVKNVAGTQVGHVPGVVVQHLAPLMDAGGVFLEGLAPRARAGQVYKMPLKLMVWCKAGEDAAVQAALRRGHLHVMPDMDAERAWQVSASQGSDVDVRGVGSPARRTGLSIPGRRAKTVDTLSKLFDDLTADETSIATMCASERIATELLPHQRQALAWMVERENSHALPPFWVTSKDRRGDFYYNEVTNFSVDDRPSPFRGGILADDMGLGKTLTVLALIATNGPGATLPAVDYEAVDTDATASPASKRSRKSGGGEASTRAQAASSPQTKGATAKRKRGRSSAGEAAAAVTGDAACPASTPPDATGPQASLVVCPMSVLSNWEGQAAEHAAGEGLSVCVHHGPQRVKHSAVELGKFDLVITTYGTMVSDSHLLKKVQWLRVVLDEGHFIKNAATQQNQVAAALPARARWIVTGTPIQNSLKDLYGLVHFLQVSPLSERSVFLSAIERPMKLGQGHGALRLKALMSMIAKRRMKDSTVRGRRLVQLPDKQVHIVKLDMSREQRSAYAAWELAGRRIISHQLEAGTLMSNYSTVLEIILRLRQICDALSLCPSQVPNFDLDALEATTTPSQQPALSSNEVQELVLKLSNLIASGATEECPVCMDDVTKPVITTCGHIFCRPCIESWLMSGSEACPLCRAPMSKTGLFDAPDSETTDAGSSQTKEAAVADNSAKLVRLMEQLQLNQERSCESGEPVKAVVFSQFAGMLALVERELKAAGIPWVGITGKTSARGRKQALETFADSGMASPRVAVVSLKAAGVGLNLTSACQVHLLDPWWNPATEEQAQDRVHRIGQRKPVEIFRYVCSDSIEERMIALQEKKRELATRAFDKRQQEDQQATRVEDIRLLMEL